MAWLTRFLERVADRDATQNDAFSLVVGEFHQALDTCNTLRTRALELEHETARTAAAAHAATPQETLDTISRLQQELSESYRASSHSTTQLLRLKEEHDRVTHEASEARKSRDALEAEHKVATQQVSVLATTVDLLKAEITSLRDAQKQSEVKLTRFETENRSLIEKLLRLKNEEASEMNHMNTMYDNLLHAATSNAHALAQARSGSDRRASAADAAGSRGAAAAAAASGVDTSEILDMVAWQSNFNVSVPKGQKLYVRAHRGQATCVRYDAPGVRIVTGGTDNMVRLWDARSGQPGVGKGTLAKKKAELRAGEASVINVACSNRENGEDMLLATGNDKIARIWSLKTGRTKQTLIGHSNKVYAGVFSHDCEKAVTGSHDRNVKVWDVSSGRCELNIRCISSCNYMSMSSNGDLIATAHLDTAVRFWSVRTGELMKEIKDVHTQQATCSEFSGDGSLIVTNSRDNTLKIVDVRVFKVLFSLRGTQQEPYVNGINWGRACFSPDGQFVVAGAQNGALFFWDTASGKMCHVLHRIQRSVPALSGASGEFCVTSVDWNRNGRQVVSTDKSGCLRIWE